MALLWLDDITAEDFDSVGGKGASLGELTAAGLPVPPGFVVTAETYRSFIEETGIDEELFEAVDVDVDDSEALAHATERAQQLIRETELPESIREEILAAYDEVGDGSASVAVRSSATAEDLPDASFAGQQETYLNITRAGLLDRVRDCWASLFTQRAIYYRQEQGFSHEKVNIAVVVQQMVDAEKSGVMFTSHPTTGDARAIVESAWGLGEAVVSGAVSPDKYVLDRESGDVTEATVATKKVMHVRDEETGETIERPVPDDKRDERVLSEAELQDLVELGERIEAHYDGPQDVEWAIFEGDIYVLQARPITTIDESAGDSAGAATNGVEDIAGVADGGAAAAGSDSTAESGGKTLVDGLGASPGRVTGPARTVSKLDHLDKVEEGDIIIAEMTTPDMVPAMKRAVGLVTDEGGLTSHAAIVSRELGVPAVTGTGGATDALADGQLIEVDGERGTVASSPSETTTGSAETSTGDATTPVAGPAKPMTATEVKVNVSLPSAAERAAATGADGVGLLRLEHMVIEMGKTPATYVADHGPEAYVETLAEGIRTVADAFYPRPVRVRTLDAPTDEFRGLEGGTEEPVEPNPMLGFRGVRRSLAEPDVFEHELSTFGRLAEMGYDNVELMFPLVNDGSDVERLVGTMEGAGLDPDRQSWGVMVETPAAALSVEEFVEAGIDFASFGTNDLTQYTLAVDRNNERIADRYDATHPAVRSLMKRVIEVCRANDVRTSICGEAASDPAMIRTLVDEGITSISANIDAVADVQREVKRVEQRLIMDSVR